MQSDPPRQININCDMAESFGIYEIGNDAELLKLVASANAACGFHAGDPMTMLRFAEQAQSAGASLGAHPGFPDLEGFGRRAMKMDFEDVKAMVLYQVSALQGMAKSVGLAVTHVKPHGALANIAAKDRTYALGIGEAIKSLDPELIFVAHFGSQMHEIACELGLRYAREGYADRRYSDDGNLASRNLPNSVVTDPDDARQQALDMVFNHQVRSITGKLLTVHVDTICVHSDKPGAVAVAAAVRRGLEDRGVAVVPLDRMALPRGKDAAADSGMVA